MFGKRKQCGECSRLAKYALADSLGVLVYVLAVSLVMTSLTESRLFAGMEFLGPATVLMMLVLSVAMVGTLIFGKPILLYLDGKKQEGVKLLVMTLLTLFVLTALVLAIGLTV